ncbi:hypothetical protein DSECCO2_584940 [anaerobic digester metagenome]
MKSSDLNNFFLGIINAKTLKSSIDADVEKYGASIKEHQSIINLNFIEDEKIIFDAAKLTRLLTETVSGVFTPVHLAFICDCLTLSEKITFENEHLKDIVFSFADPEINGGFTSTEQINEIIKAVQNF